MNVTLGKAFITKFEYNLDAPISQRNEWSNVSPPEYEISPDFSQIIEKSHSYQKLDTFMDAARDKLLEIERLTQGFHMKLDNFKLVTDSIAFMMIGLSL